VILASLAKDAAELLWEMVATEDLGDATQQMRDNASTIQVRPMVFPYSFNHDIWFYPLVAATSSNAAVIHQCVHQPGQTIYSISLMFGILWVSPAGSARVTNSPSNPCRLPSIVRSEKVSERRMH